MAIDSRINIPFIPQEGITGQILAAITAANEHHHQQQELSLRQQQLQQQGQYQQSEIANQQSEIDIRKHAQDLVAQGLPSEVALRVAQTKHQEAETAMNQTMLQQRQDMLGALGVGGQQGQPQQQPAGPMPTAPSGPTAPLTNTTQATPNPGPPPSPQADNFVSQLPPHIQPLVSGIVGGLGQTSPDENATLQAAHYKGIQDAMQQGNLGAYGAAYGPAVKDILSKRGAPEPISEFEKPEKLAAPGAQAAIQARIQDPRTKPEEVVQLTKLKTLADAAQNNAVAMKQRELRAEQAAKQGDPDAAGQMMASHQLTLTDLKTRGATPDFIEKAALSAKKYDPNYNVVAADSQAKIAASPANVAFFGNAHSLTDPGGTLDQLVANGQKLPHGSFPTINKFEDIMDAAKGKGPIAGYMATAVMVADDLAKVMGGGAGSDTSREMVLNLVKAEASGVAREASVNSIRGGVHSQTDSRIGKNPWMRQMYGDQAEAAPTTNAFSQFGGSQR